MNTASYASCVPPLALFIGLLSRMLLSKDRPKLNELIIVCVLMILSLVGTMIYFQVLYNYNESYYNGGVNRPDLINQVIQASYFASNLGFNLSHWVFAFSYLALSYRLDLVSNNLPEDTHNRRLNQVNALVCLLNVAISAI